MLTERSKREMLAKLAKLKRGPEVRALVRKSLRVAARPVLQTAKRFAPSGETGLLEQTMEIVAGKRSRRGISVFVATAARNRLGIDADAPGYYPAHVELGYRRRGRRAFGVNLGAEVPPNPFLRDAMNVERESSIEILEKNIGKGLEEIASK